ncbi:MAG: acyl-[Lachnospiraceae bacterium]|nr:acyl-[acyl-carrier-protein] thioesterase [Lachnospiraceae bacterium]
MYLFDGRIRYSEVDSEGKLTLASLINYFQDCSTFQSEDLHVGLQYMAEQHLVWVVSSWQIIVERLPMQGEYVQVGTKPYEFNQFMGLRNFAMLTKSGQYLAKANSVWSLLNTDTWKPALPPEAMRKAYVLSDRLNMVYAPRKIAVPEGGSDREGIVIKKHHLDTNNHVNNGQYVEMALEYLPEDFVLKQLRVEYKMQTLLDEVLIPHVAEETQTVTVALNGQDGRPHAVIEFAKEVAQ